MSRIRLDYRSPDFGASLGMVLAVLRAAQQPRKPRILTAEESARHAQERERAEWNRQVDERKAAKRATKEA